MKVIIEFKDPSGKVLVDNTIEKEMTSEEILVLQSSTEIDFPINNGFLFTARHCIIEKSTYDMFTEPYKLKITLVERTPGDVNIKK